MKKSMYTLCCLILMSACGCDDSTRSRRHIKSESHDSESHDSDDNTIVREYTIQEFKIPNFTVSGKAYYTGKICVNKHWYLILRSGTTKSFVHDPDCPCYKHDTQQKY